MVQQAAPSKTVQTCDGLIMARICNPEQGCVLTEVMVHLRIDDDGTWFASYWNPENPADNAVAHGTDACESRAIGSLLTAIGSLAPEMQ